MDSHGKQPQKRQKKSRSFNWYWYAFNGKKGIRRETCHVIFGYVKANTKYMKDYDKNKESPYLRCWDVNSSYGWAMSRNLPLKWL